MSPKLSVVIPLYNEEDNVSPLLAELRPVLDGLGQAYEVVLVDDGSTDSTAERLREAAAAWPQGRVIELARNQGQACALLTGFGQASGEICVTLYGDGQNDPADIPRLLPRLAEADMVIGVRAERQDSSLRRLMSRVANGVRSRFLGDGVRDTGCALKAFRREVVEAFLPIRTLYSFMPALAVASGFRVVQVEVRHRPRTRGQSKYGLRAMLWRPLVDMLGVKWFAWRRIAAQPPIRRAGPNG